MIQRNDSGTLSAKASDHPWDRARRLRTVVAGGRAPGFRSTAWRYRDQEGELSALLADHHLVVGQPGFEPSFLVVESLKNLPAHPHIELGAIDEI